MKLAAIITGALLVSAPALAHTIPPQARRVNVSETLHGVAVADPYRWLEETASPEVRSWVEAQNSAAEAFAAGGAAETFRRLLSYSDFVTRRAYQRRGDRTFYLLGWAGSPQTGLHVEEAGGESRRLAGMDSSSRDVGASGEDVAGYWPSPDGRLVLALVQPRDGRWGRLDLIDAADGRLLHSAAGVYGGFSGAAWLADGSGYAYSVYERDDEAPVNGRIVGRDLTGGRERVLFAATGENARRVLFPRAAADSNLLFVELQSVGGSSEVHVLAPGRSEAIRLFEADADWLLLGARDGDAWFYTNKDSPNGRVVRVRDVLGRATVETIIGERAGSISATSQVGGNAYGLFGDRIALLYLEDAAPVLRIFDLEGRETGRLEIPPTGSLWGGLDGDPRRSEAYYQFLGVSEPSSIYRLDLQSGRAERVAAAPVPIAPDDLVARRVFVPNGEGVRIPVLIAHRRGLSLERPRRTILYGYGAFAWVSFLWYQPHVVDWLLRDDGVFVVAGVRGGGEFGTAWHQAGIGANRQSAIDDYVAVARHLVEAGITRADLLVANGGSASGGLAAAAVNQNPGLFGAMTLDYPALDLIRYPHWGHARYWAGEFGSPDDPAEFRALLATSPYHNLSEGSCYPAALVRTGEHDPTVTPIHGFKFAARLQRSTGCERPVLLDVMEGAAHDYGATPEQVARSHAVMLEFLRRVLPSE